MIDIKEVMQFAMKAHGGQMYGNLPYITHLSDVYRVLLEFGYHNLDLLASAWLHDVLEDTEYHYSDIVNLTDESTAQMVYAVTDELGRNRKERKKKTWPKIAKNSGAMVLKQADMISNVRQGLSEESKKLNMYRKEYTAFKDYFIHMGNQDMWVELDRLLIDKLDEENFFKQLNERN